MITATNLILAIAAVLLTVSAFIGPTSAISLKNRI